MVKLLIHKVLNVLLLLTFILAACSNSDKTTISSSSVDTVKIVDAKRVMIDNTVDSIDMYFNNPVNFYALKKATEHMHSGGDIKLNNKYFHQEDDMKYIYYDYWAVEFLNKGKGLKPLCFKVLKLNQTSNDMRYDNDNEILVGIKSKMAWTGLGSSNFVEKASTEITKKFGKPNSNKNNCLVYHRNDKILILKIANKKVEWFKYFWLKDTIANIDNLPNVCFKWIE